MYINRLKDLSRDDVEFLLKNLEYKLEKYQRLYYDTDDNQIILSTPSDYSFYYNCDNKCSINTDNIVVKLYSYTGHPTKIYNKINKITTNFTSILLELQSLMITKAYDLGL